MQPLAQADIGMRCLSWPLDWNILGQESPGMSAQSSGLSDRIMQRTHTPPPAIGREALEPRMGEHPGACVTCNWCLFGRLVIVALSQSLTAVPGREQIWFVPILLFQVFLQRWKLRH